MASQASLATQYLHGKAGRYGQHGLARHWPPYFFRSFDTKSKIANVRAPLLLVQKLIAKSFSQLARADLSCA
jgi:uncharacterized membrane protein YgdD (TMEM256/DUF423 family)